MAETIAGAGGGVGAVGGVDGMRVETRGAGGRASADTDEMTPTTAVGTDETDAKISGGDAPKEKEQQQPQQQTQAQHAADEGGLTLGTLRRGAGTLTRKRSETRRELLASPIPQPTSVAPPTPAAPLTPATATAGLASPPANPENAPRPPPTLALAQPTPAPPPDDAIPRLPSGDSSASVPEITVTAATLPRGTLPRGTLGRSSMRRGTSSRRSTGPSSPGASGGSGSDDASHATATAQRSSSADGPVNTTHAHVHLTAPHVTANPVSEEFAKALRGGPSAETTATEKTKKRSFWDLLSTPSIFSSRTRITSRLSPSHPQLSHTSPSSHPKLSDPASPASHPKLSDSSPLTKPPSRAQSGGASLWRLARARTEKDKAHGALGGMGGAAGAGYSTRIKDYELLSQIGGVDDLSFLYLARHIPTRELVALKYTDLTISPDFELVEEVIHTIHITTHLSHPVLLPYRTSFVDADRLWSVTLPIRGGSCRQIMREYFPDGFGFKESVVATIVREIVRGVQYMHASHVLHNDIRASSILLSHTGAVLLTGLHAARPLLTSGLLHRSTFIPVGDNHEHAAPEIVAQGRRVGMPADVYSIGHTAVELAFGKTGFDGWPSCKILLCKLADECPAPDVGTGWAGVSGGDADEGEREDARAMEEGNRAGVFAWGAKRKAREARKRRGMRIGKGMSYEFWMFVECCTRRDPKKRPTTTELLEHPFLAMARDAKHVQKYVLKPSGLVQRHDSAIRASAATASHSSPTSHRQSAVSVAPSSRRSSSTDRRRSSATSKASGLSRDGRRRSSATSGVDVDDDGSMHNKHRYSEGEGESEPENVDSESIQEEFGEGVGEVATPRIKGMLNRERRDSKGKSWMGGR